MLYLSYYLKQNRARYYALLTRVRETGDWEEWVRFFLEGVRDTADGAARTARDALRLFEGDRARIQSGSRLIGSALRVHEALQRHPLLSVSAAAAATGLSYPTVDGAMRQLESLGIVTEPAMRQRNRLYYYARYLALLGEGTEPLAASPARDSE